MRRAVLAVVALVLSACSGVPRTSEPSVVTSVGLAAPTPRSTLSPAPGMDPRSIVTTFLQANVSGEERHGAARSFLTADAARVWTDRTVTVVDEYTVDAQPGDPEVTVSGRRIATLDARGIYTPSVQPWSASFGLKRVNDEWRIDKLDAGLIVNRRDFGLHYVQRLLYFPNQAGTRVLADPRYTALANQSALATWLIGQLLGGPRPELVNAVLSVLPEQVDPPQVDAAASPVTVEMPGASRLAAGTLELLAAQVALTLGTRQSRTLIAITDGGRPVSIPNRGATVSSADFQHLLGLRDVTPLFYVRNGAMIDRFGAPTPGEYGTGKLQIRSVGVADRGTPDYLVAIVDAEGRLLAGPVSEPPRDTGLPRSPATTRPAWMPGTAEPEVWAGSGQRLVQVRLTAAGATRQDVPMSSDRGPVRGVVKAVRFSVDGARVALVITSGSGTAAWVGTVVRAADRVRVDSLVQVTPPDAVVSDAAWNDQSTLYLVGSDRSGVAVWQVSTDGSRFEERSHEGLPSNAVTITAAVNELPWIGTPSELFRQSGTEWISPFRPNQSAAGTNPVYAE